MMATDKTYKLLYCDILFNPDNSLEPNPLQLPLVRGRANLAPPLTRGGWEGFEPNGLSGF
jgi:hypothetical protein